MYLLKAMHHFKNTVKSLIFELTFYEQMIININCCSRYNSTCFSKKKKKKKKNFQDPCCLILKGQCYYIFKKILFSRKSSAT